MTQRRWDKARRNPRGQEAAAPKQAVTPLRGGSHVKPGKVKRWDDMTPEEKKAIVKAYRSPIHRDGLDALYKATFTRGGHRKVKP